MSTEHSPQSHPSADDCSVSTLEAKDLRRGGLTRTPLLKKVQCSFKSPTQVTKSAKVSPAEEVAELKRRRDQLDTDIAQLEAEGYSVEELEHHIDKLHEYNDIKDIGQSLLGRIAALRGTTTRDLYSHFGLDLDD
ncbi:DNA repair protein SWI5 homolog [Echeneis naucrates]|uniref:DNA repair protein SWI5 homolog n=1 Tax=Echeneis naucrates TaxID=173247 RepID=A0A665WV49_ECHNA|nr:DNA repair protein SWI5 homolog [Echeneis naucrates]